MKHRFTILFISIFLFILSHQSAAQVPIEFYENWESIPQQANNRIGLDDTLISVGPVTPLKDHDLYEFSLLTADSEGNLAGFDYGLSKIVYFNHNNLTDISFLGEGDGKGPREFQTPQDLKFDSKGNIWLSDVGVSRITKWSTEGELLNTVSPSGRFLVPARMAVCSDENLYVISNQYAGKGVIHLLDANGNHINSFQEIRKPLQRYPAYMEGEVTCSRNDLFIAGRFKNYIRKYNSNGKLQFSRSVVDFEPNKEPMVRREGRFTSRSKDVRRASGDISVNNDTLYVGFSGNKDGWLYNLDAYDTNDGDYIRSYAFNTPVREFVVSQNKIYVIEFNYEDRNRQLAVYKLPN